jgi:hypothetical protein
LGKKLHRSQIRSGTVGKRRISLLFLEWNSLHPDHGLSLTSSAIPAQGKTGERNSVFVKFLIAKMDPLYVILHYVALHRNVPEVGVRFPALRDFLISSGFRKGSTQPREYN